jgi:steroid delta-isomerase-like uncharacterized protein
MIGGDVRSTVTNKNIARKFFEEFDRQNFDGIAALLAPGEVAHLPGASQPLDWPAHRQYASAFIAAFPDGYHVVEDQIADEHNVVSRVTFHGTHKGSLMGIPATGKTIAMDAISWFRIENGFIAEEWTELDRLGMMVQLGVAGAPPPGGELRTPEPDRREQVSTLSDPRAAVGRWFERIDRGGVPDVDQYVVNGYRDHNPPPIQGLAAGATGLRQVFAFALTAFAEFHHEIAASISEGDYVASRVTGFGKHTGDFLGIPATGKHVTMSGITIHRVTNGKLSEHWAQIDALSLLQQLGAVPG